jgi:hypothetical protein
MLWVIQVLSCLQHFYAAGFVLPAISIRSVRQKKCTDQNFKKEIFAVETRIQTGVHKLSSPEVSC